MTVSRLFWLAICVGSWASGALAQEASEQVHACIATSTEGQTQRDEGRLLEARAAFLSCAQESCPAIVRKSCAEWLVELAPRIPSVVVRVHDAEHRDLTDAAVTIDGVSTALDGRPVMLDPGTHALKVSTRDGAVEQTFLLAEREQARLLTVNLPDKAKAPAAPPPPLIAKHVSFRVPAAGWVLGGLGVAGVVTFAALRTRDVHYLHELDACSPNCSAAQRDAGKRKALAADVSLGVGIAALAGATLWTLGSWLVHQKRDEPSALGVLPAHGGASATYAGRF